MSQKSILVIEDEEDIQELITYNLEKEGFRVACVSTAEEGWRRLRAKAPDLIVLDLMLPGMDGLSFCRELRAERRNGSVAVLMLTAKSEEADVVSGLEVGADDYMVKPFSPRVLLARVRALLRRRGPDKAPSDAFVKRGQIEIDPPRYEVKVKGKPIDLTCSEFKILHLLAGHPGIVFSRYQIVDSVHGQDYPVTDRSIDVQIVGLRKKLGGCSDCIETIRGIGYRFRADVDA